MQFCCASPTHSPFAFHSVCLAFRDPLRKQECRGRQPFAGVQGCPLKILFSLTDEHSNTFKGIVFKLVARKSLFYVETVIFDNHNGSCPFPLRGQCCRPFDAPTDVQPIEAKEEIHHWEKHTGKFRVRVKRSMPDRVLCASSGPLRKRCSSAGTAIVLSAHLLLARIIGITVLFAFSRVMSITGDREIA